MSSTGRYDFTIKPTKKTTYTYRVVLRATGPKANVDSKAVKIRAT